FFVCDYAGPKNQESFFNFRNASGVEAPIIALGDKFSYKIEVDASTNMLSVTVYVNGEAYSAKTAVNDVWQNDALYFKAGVYLGTNETTATGSGEVAFYALDYGHSAGMGLGGLQDTSLTASTVSLTGGSDDDVLHGGIKNDVLNGGDGNDILNGYDGNDKLSGGNGNDLLNGGTGSDTMAGGAGDDTYYVDSSGDVVSETSGNGTDIVIASINYTLASNVENLTLAGSANLNGTGNNLANLLLGNDGDNVLDGAGGADTMRGFDGNDTYYVNTTKDVVIEQMGDGKDLVISTVNYTLSNYVEALTLAGTADLNGTGNAQNNTITGNAGNNKLDGAGGVDTMAGGTGDDIYYADSSSDKIVEYAAQGYDTVRAAASFTLRDNVEALYLMGTDNINGTGNSLANLIDGNGGVNILNGGLGNDTLKGDGGADQFVFNTTIVGGRNVDHITDFKTQWDSIDLDHLIFGALSAGHLTDNAFAVGRAATTADQHIIYDAASGALYYDPDGVGGQAQIQFAVLDHAPSLSAADFTIF
ncbi:MAG: polysaccharide lyase family 7 protein, partial [Asticcacaulis sp.]|nr:polysaccharide lyase family 7 protein [Asticcacaulis sp.]